MSQVKTAPRGALATLALALVLGACSNGESEGDGGSSTPAQPLTYAEAVALNARGVVLMDQQKTGEATGVFRELTVRAPDCVTGWMNYAIALLNNQESDPEEKQKLFGECEVILRRIMTSHPELPHAPYTLGLLLDHLGGDRAEITAAFARAHQLAPTSADTCYRLGKSYYETRPPELERAVELLERAVAYEPHFQGAYHSLHGAFRRLRQQERANAAIEFFRAFEDAKPSLGKKLTLVYNSMGRYANVLREVAPFGQPFPALPTVPLEFTARAKPGARATAWPASLGAGESIRAFLVDRVVPLLAGGIAFHDLDGADGFELSLVDANGNVRLFRTEAGAFVQTRVLGASDFPGLVPVGSVFGDVNHDGAPDLLVFGAGPDALFLNDGAGALKLTFRFGGETLTGAAQFVDADHDGDLDLLLAGYLELPPADVVAPREMQFPDDFAGAPNGLWSNHRPTIYDSAPAAAEAFTDLGERTGLRGANERTASILAIDLDGDGDVDILEANDGQKNRAWLNDRLWRYHEAPPSWRFDDAGPALDLAAADVDQDGRLDVFLTRGRGAATVLYENRAPEGLAASTSWLAAFPDAAHDGLVHTADFDNDGDLDLALAPLGADAIWLARRDGAAWTQSATLAFEGQPLGVRSTSTVDIDGDGKLDLVFGQPTDAGIFRNETKTGHWLALDLRGKQELSLAETWSNDFGVGGTVEVAVEDRRIYLAALTRNGGRAGPSPRLHVGLGSAEGVGYVRVLWPDLVLQTEDDFAIDRVHELAEVNRKASSCPVLFKYSGAGDSFDFVTDFLGVGGLGFFVAPGLYAPPDPTELVRIGDLPERDGTLELRIAEPMEEICYLDELALVVVDHPADATAYADERLATAAPFPTGAPIVVGAPIAPTSARTRAGEDTLAELLATDRVYQKGLRRDRRFLGYLEEPQHLVLTFDQNAVQSRRPTPESRLHLFLDGWVEYPYSHVNFAGWQAHVRSQSLSLDVAGADGTWETAIEEIGYPAGMSRTMAIDVTALAERGLGRLRLRTNLEIYVDRITVAWSLDPTRSRTARHDFDRAELRFLGYPREESPDGRLPKLYDYQQVDPTFDWKTMAGRYTRYGDVRELLTSSDDRYVVMNHGEEIALSLDASRLPPLPAGYARTFFLKADGWCKDMDPYTAAPDTVAPLPHHAMSEYPPPPGEGYPDRDAAWMETWNTREIEGTLPVR